MPIKLTWDINEDIYVKGTERSTTNLSVHIVSIICYIFPSVCYDVFLLGSTKKDENISHNLCTSAACSIKNYETSRSE